METFISWSGQRSKAVAEAIRQWLPKVIQSARPWMSGEDISAGARWLTDVAGTLNNAKVGIICVTPENQTNPWLLFEAGALSKTLEQTRVCPLAFKMSPGQITGPLSQFQGNELNREGIGRVLKTINESVNSDRAISAAELDEIIDVWWPKLEERLNGIPNPVAPTPARDVGDQIEELLILSRENLRRENLRLEASKERDQRAEQMIQLMERAGLTMSHADSNAKKMQTILGSIELGASGKMDGAITPQEQGQLMQQVLSALSPAALVPPSVAELQQMVQLTRELHERGKLHTEDLLAPVVTGAAEFNIDATDKK